ncbi:MAG TPA: hypothetical protein VMJ64_14120 [Anaerolineales bacterium]|nr:hypothetical protein [Anaerolineales bacterium]
MQAIPTHSNRSRLPARRDILGVFSAVLFVVFGWSIRGFLYKIPAFALYFGLGTNLAILCYMFAFALIESILVTGTLVVVAAILPPGVFRQGFSYKGFIVVLVASVAMILFEGYYQSAFFKDIMAGNDSSIPPFVLGSVASLIALAALLWVAHVQPRVRRVAQYIVDQLSIFAYIYVPLGLLGLAVVILRNLR